MKRTRKSVFFIFALVIVLFTCTAITGVYGQNGDFKNTYIKGLSDIRWGIDIKGGVEATFSPADGIEANSTELEAAKAIVETRLVANNITDYELYTDSSNNRIIVRYPWKSDETEFDPESAIEELAATALLTFREGSEYESTEYADDGSIVYKTPSGTTAESIILEGSDVVSATPVVNTDSTSGSYEYMVSLEFSESGKEKFAEATTNLVGSTISIWMDDVMISSAKVNEAITDGKCVISGSFTSTEVSQLASKISAGALPFALEVSSFNTVTPTLGTSALSAMALAGIIAFLVIAVMMLVFYRLPGFVAIISLAGQLAITFAAISGYFSFNTSFTMTLPGIAGIILSIGMGVDANIITASRIREELQTGKSLNSAVEKGTKNSFWAIFDGNITVLIVALMLIGVFGPSNILSLIFGQSTTGSIYSFGYTLLVGTLGNFVMGLFASRKMIKSLSNFKIFRSPVLYGARKDGSVKKEFAINFYANRKKYIIASIAVIAVGLVFNIAFGTQLDMQFAGGASIKYSVSGTTVSAEEIEDAVQSELGRTASVDVNESLVSGDENMETVTITFAGNEALSLEEQKSVQTTLETKYSDGSFELVESNSIDPVMGSKFLQKCLVCILITFAFLLIYIAMRFKKIGGLSAGVTAIIALLHDVVIVYLSFVVFKLSIDDIFIAVILTILGYSLNDTIVVYDRIRENKRLQGNRHSLSEITDMSLNQTKGRSFMTSLSTFLALLVVFVVGVIYGIDTVVKFSLPMMIGVVAGCYSSLFIVAPNYTWWQIRKKEKKDAGLSKSSGSSRSRNTKIKIK